MVDMQTREKSDAIDMEVFDNGQEGGLIDVLAMKQR